MELEELLREVIDESDRGLSSRICENTSLSKTDLSLWGHDHRPLPARKLVEAIDYLISEGIIVVSKEIVRRG